VTVNNAPPVIANLTGDTEIDEGDTATFNAIATDPGAGELTYTWDFGDGSKVSGTEVMITQRFVEDGEYDLNLTVSDEDGAIASRTVTIKVNNVAPIIEAQTDRTANEGESVAFNASFSDPGLADTHTIEWDFGDGSEHLTVNSEPSTVSHVYSDNGEYDVTVTICEAFYSLVSRLATICDFIVCFCCY
jgi:large repetitive protein